MKILCNILIYIVAFMMGFFLNCTIYLQMVGEEPSPQVPIELAGHLTGAFTILLGIFITFRMELEEKQITLMNILVGGLLLGSFWNFGYLTFAVARRCVLMPVSPHDTIFPVVLLILTIIQLAHLFLLKYAIKKQI